ncbi:MAG: hypothetical protein HY043_20700 [Verrucomicrobia bacterium]|nr:hypothetical protein [Verrucomicrobiota bacterium]
MSLTPILAAANSWESLLIFVGLVLISAISNWLKKKRAGQGEADWPAEENTLPIPRPRPPAQTPPRPTPSQPRNWEEELRRLLGEEEPAHPPPVPAPRTPPTAAPTPASTSKPVKLPPAPVVSQPLSTFEMPPMLQEISVEDSPNLELSHREMELARMDESRQSHQRAARLQGQVADQMQQANEQVSRHTHARRLSASTEAAQVVAMLRHPRTARQAFVASLVFDPPKAFEA